MYYVEPYSATKESTDDGEKNSPSSIVDFPLPPFAAAIRSRRRLLDGDGGTYMEEEEGNRLESTTTALPLPLAAWLSC